jgi:flavodoxin
MLEREEINQMKWLYPLLAAVLPLLCLTPCGASAADNGGPPGGTASSGSSAGSTGAPKILVAYFSCTGATETIAEYAADALGADLYKIQPLEPYTAADLNYRDRDSRASREHNDAAARPAISGGAASMGKYDIVFLGYPIWWGEAPRIVNSFLESHDFSGKTIAPFCTSGSSGIGSSAEKLRASCAAGAAWLPGARLAGGATRREVAEWLAGLGPDLRLKSTF